MASPLRRPTGADPVPSWCAATQTIFLDLDGCVWFGGQLAPGAGEAVERLRSSGRRVVFLSNVSSATRVDIAEKLSRLGVPATADDVQVPVELLPRHDFLAGGAAKIFPLCAARVRQEMTKIGLSLTYDPNEAQVVVVGRDEELSYSELASATQALYRGARLLALNIDSRVPLEGGVIAPGTGAIVAALIEATGARLETIGKPSSFFFTAAMEAFGARARTSVMVGDTLDSDIAGGRAAGMKTVLVGASHYTRMDEPPVPDLELTGISDLPHYFQ